MSGAVNAEAPAAPRRAAGRGLDALIAVAGALLLLAVASVPLTPRGQAIFAVITAATFLVANRLKGRGVSVFLVVLSLAVSLRYIFWRVTATLDFPARRRAGRWASVLVVAELYAIIVLVLGYVQTLWPLERKPMPLPEDVSLWPTVDVYVPTYNEPMAIVRATVLGAIAMDWPREKMRVWLLDDGRREEFRRVRRGIAASATSPAPTTSTPRPATSTTR